MVAGLTVAAYLIPQVMAYAAIAGLAPIAGLWASVPALMVYAWLGTSRRLSVGPESSTALLSATIIAPLAAGDPSRYAVLSAALAFVYGGYCLIAWLLRLGFVADLLSRPVLVGYMAGTAVVMVAGQLGRLTGARVTGRGFETEVSSLVRHLSDVKPLTLSIGIGCLALTLLAQRWRPAMPGPLVAIVLATALVAALGLDHHGVAVVGRVAGAVPAAPELPQWNELQRLLLPAAGILAVGYSDTIVTGRAFAARDEETLDANRELLALGAANIGSSLVRGFSVSSSASRTALGVTAGSQTQLYSLVCVVAVLAVMVFGRPLLANVPQAALGGLVVYAAVRLVDTAELRRLAQFRRSEFWLAMATTASVIAVGLLYGVLIAVALSVVVMLARIARPHDAVLGQVPGLAGMHDVEDYAEAVEVPGLVVYRYDSPLFFANAEDFKRRALEAVDRHPATRWFVLNVEANVEVDITALDALESLRAALVSRGIIVALARVKKDLLDDLDAVGLADAIGRERLYPTLPTAVAAYEQWRRAGSERHAV